MTTTTITKPTREGVKAARKLSREADRARKGGAAPTAEQAEGEMAYRRLEAQSEANRTTKPHHLVRFGDRGLTMVMNDWDLEFRIANRMPMPAVLETYTMMGEGWWYGHLIGF